MCCFFQFYTRGITKVFGYFLLKHSSRVSHYNSSLLSSMLGCCSSILIFEDMFNLWLRYSYCCMWWHSTFCNHRQYPPHYMAVCLVISSACLIVECHHRGKIISLPIVCSCTPAPTKLPFLDSFLYQTSILLGSLVYLLFSPFCLGGIWGYIVRSYMSKYENYIQLTYKIKIWYSLFILDLNICS